MLLQTGPTHLVSCLLTDKGKTNTKVELRLALSEKKF